MKLDPMTTLQIVGALMIAAVFVALFVFMWRHERSWKVPAAIFGIVAALVAFLALASALLTGAIA